MEIFLNDLFEFIKEIISIPSKVYESWAQVMLHPKIFFNNSKLDGANTYFGFGLGLISFLFSYTVPSKEYSNNPVLKWLIQIPLGKLIGLLSKGGVLYMSGLLSIPILFCYLFVYLFSESSGILPGLHVLLYSMGTIYLTSAFVLMIEHLVNKGMRKLSILEAWKITMEEGMKLEDELKKEVLPLEKGIRDSFWQRSKRSADIGVKVAAPFLKSKISTFQKILLVILLTFAFVHPIFCLTITKF